MGDIANIIVGISIIFPVFIGLIMLLLRNTISRGIITTLTSVMLMLFSIFMLVKTPFTTGITLLSGIDISTIIMIGDFILLAIMFLLSIKYKKILPILLIIFQLVPLVYFEFIMKPHVESSLGYISFSNDHLSMVMMLLILIVGSLIAVFAVRYMNDFEHHSGIEKSRQPFFFVIIFLFLGAMSGIVLSNNLLYMYFFWEVTTLCSFLLISFSKTEESIKNAFRALWMNLIGGIAFIIAIILFYQRVGTYAIDEILFYVKLVPNTTVLSLPLALLAIAAFTKAAQFPFQSWLLGAMVAPTPVSALLHSSTMVKAGVYLLVRFSPAFMNTKLGYAIAVIGGFSFLAGSALAISQSNAKRVLAYSTVANLGLIVATAGIGTPLAITAAVLLIMFHGVSKALLFLCVGTIEHGIESRDVEDMDGLVSKMPLIGILTVIGMFSMLLPPFGVIITKLLGIEAATNAPVVLLFMVLGSALTVMFWAKWMGKVLTISNIKEEKLENYSFYTIAPLSILAFGVVLISVGIVWINKLLIEPYISYSWMIDFSVNFNDMLLIPMFIAILCLISLIPVFIVKTKPQSYREPYLCGENVCEGSRFKSALDVKVKASTGNYYLNQFFSESQLTSIVNIFALAFIFFMFGVIL